MIAVRWSVLVRAVLPHSLAPLLALLLVALPLCVARAQGSAAPASTTDVAAQPGDKVRLKIYRESELSGEFIVPEDGIVVFPKIGAVGVNRIAADSLHSLLVAQYSKSLRDPAIEVTVLRRVNVIGAVRSPGFYYADPTVTVRGALALAGGTAPEGDKNRLDLTRAGKRTSVSLKSTGTVADTPVQSGDEVSAPDRSWLSRNTALVVSGVSGLALIFVTLVRK